MAEDLRVRKTKRALREALLKLMETKPIDSITTSELCRKAEVNRNTFYAHYSSPFQLLQTIEDEYIASIQSFVNDTLDPLDYTTLMKNVCQSMSDNRELTSVLYSQNGNKNFLSRFIGVLQPRVLLQWSTIWPKLAPEDLELLYNYTTFGVERCILRWTEDGFRTPPEEFARKLTEMTEVVLSHYADRDHI